MERCIGSIHLTAGVPSGNVAREAAQEILAGRRRPGYAAGEMERDRVLAWASGAVRRPWEEFCGVAGTIAGGGAPTCDRVKIPLAGIEVHVEALYDFLREAFAYLLPRPATLLTVVHHEGVVLRAYLEHTRDGHFVELEPVPRLHGLAADPDRLREAVPEAGWVKTADLRFFETFAALPEGLLARAGLAEGIRRLAEASLDVIRAGWIDFTPAPRGWEALQRWARRDPRPEVPLAPLEWPRTVHVALRGPHYVSLLRLSAVAPERCTEPAEAAAPLRGAPVRALPALVRERLGSDLVFAIDARWLLRLSERPALPALSRLLAARGSRWEVDPTPVALRRLYVWPVRAAIAWPIPGRGFGWRRPERLRELMPVRVALGSWEELARLVSLALAPGSPLAALPELVSQARRVASLI